MQEANYTLTRLISDTLKGDIEEELDALCESAAVKAATSTFSHPILRQENVGKLLGLLYHNTKTLVFKGGGAKGIGHVGALAAITETGLCHNVTEVVGSSVGSLVSLCISLGLTPTEIQETISSISGKDVNDGWKLKQIPRLLLTGSINSGEHLAALIKAMIAKAGIEAPETFSFNDLHELRQQNPGKYKDLFVTMTKMNTALGEKEVNDPSRLTSECVMASFRNPQTGHLPIWKVVLTSSSLPIFFKPTFMVESLYDPNDIQIITYEEIKQRHKHRSRIMNPERVMLMDYPRKEYRVHTCMDGGVSDNFALSVKDQLYKNPNTLGFYLAKHTSGKKSTKKRSAVLEGARGYTKELAGNEARTAVIKLKRVKTTTFELSPEMIAGAILSGREAMERLLATQVETLCKCIKEKGNLQEGLKQYYQQQFPQYNTAWEKYTNELLLAASYYPMHINENDVYFNVPDETSAKHLLQQLCKNKLIAKHPTAELITTEQGLWVKATCKTKSRAPVFFASILEQLRNMQTVDYTPHQLPENDKPITQPMPTFFKSRSCLTQKTIASQRHKRQSKWLIDIRQQAAALIKTKQHDEHFLEPKKGYKTYRHKQRAFHLNFALTQVSTAQECYQLLQHQYEKFFPLETRSDVTLPNCIDKLTRDRLNQELKRPNAIQTAKGYYGFLEDMLAQLPKYENIARDSFRML